MISINVFKARINDKEDNIFYRGIIRDEKFHNVEISESNWESFTNKLWAKLPKSRTSIMTISFTPPKSVFSTEMVMRHLPLNAKEQKSIVEIMEKARHYEGGGK